jgi:hypothetical protein
MLEILIANESDQSYSYSSERYDDNQKKSKKHQKEIVRVEDVICLLREYGWTEQ